MTLTLSSFFNKYSVVAFIGGTLSVACLFLAMIAYGDQSISLTGVYKTMLFWGSIAVIVAVITYVTPQKPGK